MRNQIRLAAVSTLVCLMMTPLVYGRGFGGGFGGGGMRGGFGGGGGGFGGGGMRGGGGFGGGGGGFGGGMGGRSFGGGGGGGGLGGDRGFGGGGFGGGGGGGGGFGGGGDRGFGGLGGGGGGFGGAGDRGLGGLGAGGAGDRGFGAGGLGGSGFGDRGFGGSGLGGAGDRGFGASGLGGAGDRGFGASGLGGAGDRGIGGAGVGDRGVGAAGDRFGFGAAGAAGAVGRFPTDFGLSRYSSFGAAGAVGHETHLWNNNYLSVHGNYVRANFNNYGCFRPGWYTNHPGAWFAAGWATGAAWRAAAWPALATFCSIPAAPVYYDYGNTVVYQGGDVYVNGSDAGSAADYSQQATALADQGQQAQTPSQDQWQALGVFALVQGEDDKSSNNLFQLAVNQSGVIRGNFYEALSDQTTPVYGSVDSQTQRAAWTIGDKKDRVFDTGIYNLTKDQTPVLVHSGNDSTQQLLLVRLKQQQQDGPQAGQPGQ